MAMNKLLLLVGILTLVGGAVFLYLYINQHDSTTERTNLILGGALSAIALICFAIYFFKKFKEEGDQEISITKF